MDLNSIKDYSLLFRVSVHPERKTLNLEKGQLGVIVISDLTMCLWRA